MLHAIAWPSSAGAPPLGAAKGRHEPQRAPLTAIFREAPCFAGPANRKARQRRVVATYAASLIGGRFDGAVFGPAIVRSALTRKSEKLPGVFYVAEA